MNLWLVLRFFVGILLLTGGAELLVRGASRLAASWGVTPLIIGLTVVAFGTSAPELAVSVRATTMGQTSIAMGNIIGSNIFNVLFILGISAAVTPLVVSARLVRIDVPLMILASLVFWGLALDGWIGPVESGLLVAALIAYTLFLIRSSRRERAAETEPAVLGESNLLVDGVSVLGGIALLVLGSHWLVEGAVAFARVIGVSELVIGLTLIAAGTSLPELATSVVASLRGQRDIAVGNVVGSNLFNILGIAGIAGLIGDGLQVPAALTAFDLPVMTVVAIACLPIFFSDSRISRWEGMLFVGYYIAYTVYVVLAATHHDALPAFSRVMIGFALPITIVTLVIIALPRRD
jgi:cation:H+ antiporter